MFCFSHIFDVNYGFEFLIRFEFFFFCVCNRSKDPMCLDPVKAINVAVHVYIFGGVELLHGLPFLSLRPVWALAFHSDKLRPLLLFIYW